MKKTLSGKPSPADSANAFAHNASMALKALSSLSLPPHAVGKMQGDYLKHATDLWNQSLQALTKA